MHEDLEPAATVDVRCSLSVAGFCSLVLKPCLRQTLLEAKIRDKLTRCKLCFGCFIVFAMASGAVASSGPVRDGGLTPTPTPVEPLGEGKAGQASRAVKPMTPHDVAAYRPAQDPSYDPTEGRAGASALPTALPSAGNDQIDNPLFEEQQQQDISSTAFDQGNDTSPIPFASNRQQEFHSSMYGSSMERQPSSSSFSESSLSSLQLSQQQPSEYGMSANPTFSSHSALGFQQQQTTAPSVAATSLASFYQGPFFPPKSSLTASQQLTDDKSAQPAAAEQAAAVSAPTLSSIPLLGSTAQQPELKTDNIAVSAEADFNSPNIQSHSSAQQHAPLNIPPPFSVSDDSVSASTAAAEPTSAVSVVSPRSTEFDDGPTFAGSPLYSPPDNDTQPFISEDPPFAQVVVPFSSELPKEHSYAATPIFQDNPVFSDIEQPPPAVPLMYPHQPLSGFDTNDNSFVEQVPEALSSSPIPSRFDMQRQQQQHMVSEAAPVEEPMVYDEAFDIPTGPDFMTDSPALASTPILSSSGSSQTVEYTTSASMPQPVASFQELLLAAHSPTLHSNPTFSDEPPLAEQPQAYPPMGRQTSITLSEPKLELPYSSTPIFGSQLQEPQLTAPPLQSTPPLDVSEELSTGDFPYSNQPIFGAVHERPAPTFMQSEPSFALPEDLAAAELEAELSNQPIFGKPGQQQQQQQQQQQEMHSPTQAATSLQSEPSLALPQPLTPAQETRTLSNQPILGEQQQQQQQQQQWQRQHCRGQNSSNKAAPLKPTFSSGCLAPPAHVGSHEEAPPPDPPWEPEPLSPPLPNRPPKVPPCCLEGLPLCLDGLTGSSSAMQKNKPKPTCQYPHTLTHPPRARSTDVAGSIGDSPRP